MAVDRLSGIENGCKLLWIFSSVFLFCLLYSIYRCEHCVVIFLHSRLEISLVKNKFLVHKENIAAGICCHFHSQNLVFLKQISLLALKLISIQFLSSFRIFFCSSSNEKERNIYTKKLYESGGKGWKSHKDKAKLTLLFVFTAPHCWRHCSCSIDFSFPFSSSTHNCCFSAAFSSHSPLPSSMLYFILSYCSDTVAISISSFSFSNFAEFWIKQMTIILLYFIFYG